ARGAAHRRRHPRAARAPHRAPHRHDGPLGRRHRGRVHRPAPLHADDLVAGAERRGGPGLPRLDPLRGPVRLRGHAPRRRDPDPVHPRLRRARGRSQSGDVPPVITVTLLGTGSPIPHPDRAGPATLVSVGDHHVLVDAGRGVLMRLAAAGLGVDRLAGVLVTHLHSDHVTDLTDLITSTWVMTFTPTPLRIVGPPGTRQFVDHLLASLGPDIGY